MIKGSIDFDRVEEFCQILCLMKTPRARRRIDHAVPVLVGPAGRADKEFRLREGSRLLFGWHARWTHKSLGAYDAAARCVNHAEAAKGSGFVRLMREEVPKEISAALGCNLAPRALS